jgi:hypothetical protein
VFKDPGRQFNLIAQHVAALRTMPGRAAAPIMIYVERNLGFESEHHRRALDSLPGVAFYVDQKANRVGVLTTEAIKHAMCQLVVVMLNEKRIHVWNPVVSRDGKSALLRLREQMEVYSYQFKMGTNTFQKDRIVLSGKVGGMKDDICICLQLACYFTQIESQRAVQLLNTPVG